MDNAQFMAKGRELVERFAVASEGKQRIGELAAAMLGNPMSPEQFEEMQKLVEQVATHWLELRAELDAYSLLLRHRN